jgi:hypothetical protein
MPRAPTAPSLQCGPDSDHSVRLGQFEGWLDAIDLDAQELYGERESADDRRLVGLIGD